jgi:flagellar biosynthesis/type III secretory pathway protein FliH
MICQHFGVQVLDQPLPPGIHIIAHQLVSQFDANGIISAARFSAAEIELQARHKCQSRLQHYRKRLSQLRKAAENRAHCLFSEAREQGSVAAIEWLVEQSTWQDTIYQLLSERITSRIIAQLNASMNTIAWDALLMSHIPQWVEEYANESRLVLKVAPELVESISLQSRHLAINIQADASLEPGVAVFETPLARTKINVAKQLDHIITLLNAAKGDAARGGP